MTSSIHNTRPLWPDSLRRLSSFSRFDSGLLQKLSLIEKLKLWVDGLKDKTTPKSALGKALTYIDNQWVGLQRYLEDGAVPIDNSAIERGHRPTAVGRRNWLYAGSHEAAARVATLYTVIDTCIYCGVNPAVYIADVLKLIQERESSAKLTSLLPGAWAARQKAEQHAQA